MFKKKILLLTACESKMWTPKPKTQMFRYSRIYVHEEKILLSSQYVILGFAILNFALENFYLQELCNNWNYIQWLLEK